MDDTGSTPLKAFTPPKTPQEIAEVQAIGQLLVDKRSRKDLIDGGYNRYSFDDDLSQLPDWFVEEEERYMRPQLPVTKEMVQAYRAKLTEISRRPIRKVLEAAGRKATRLKQRMARMQKQVDGVANSPELSESSKCRTIRQMVGKLIREDKKPIKYIVSQRSNSRVAKNAPKSKGARVKIVDRRMKKDKRAQEARARKNRGRPKPTVKRSKGGK